MIRKCRSCLSNKLTNILTLGDQYLSDFREDDKKPPQYPLNIVMCKNCSLVQLRESTPPVELYNDNYGYYSGINNTIKADLRDIVEKTAQRVSLSEYDIVIDIGSNDGTLLKNYPKNLIRIGFDPVSKFKEFYNEENLIFVNGFFNKEAYVQALKKCNLNKKAKIITNISCFYDLEDPNTFVDEVRQILHPEGIYVIQQNYLGTMLENVAFDNVVHEHLEYYSLKSLEYLLNRHYLKIVDIELNNINGGSIRTYVKHMDNVERLRVIEEQMKIANQWTYVMFSMKVKNTAKKVHDFITEEVGKGKTVYAYGASTRGNCLMQACGLDSTLIKAAVERNPVKFGKKIASLRIPIISEEQARKDKPDYFLVNPWFFADEFKKREAEYVKNGGKLIFPLPEFEIYEG